MVDTTRTIAYLTQQAFQDGQPAGSITPQDMRDLIVSVSPNESVLTFNQNLTWNLAVDPVAQVTLTANVIITLTNGEQGRAYRLAIIQGGTGSNTISFVGGTLLNSPIYRTTIGLVNLVDVDIVGQTRYLTVI